MPQLVDARGNEFYGTIDQVGGGVITDARAASAVLGALNAEAIMDLQGHAVAMFDVRTAAANLTLVFEGTIDGVNYMQLPALNVFQEAYYTNIGITTVHSAQYVIGVSGYRRVRARISTYTSGNVTVAARGSRADYMIITRNLPSPNVVVVAGAANAIATLTLPNPGAGLFHQITYLDIRRHATAALAGTAAVAITSTNLNGWGTRVGNAMIAGGTQIDVQQQFSSALKSQASGVATTIVGAAPGAAVLWNMTAHYYVGM